MPIYAVHRDTNQPPILHTGKLDLGYRHIFLINNSFFLFFSPFTLQFILRRGKRGRFRRRCPYKLANATTGHGFVPSLLHSVYRPTRTCTLLYSTGGSTAHFHGDLKWNRSSGKNMVICFTQLIRHGSDRLHLAPPPPQSRPPRPMGFNTRTYNNQYSRVFGLPQFIRAINQGNYNLMLLAETMIPDAV